MVATSRIRRIVVALGLVGIVSTALGGVTSWLVISGVARNAADTVGAAATVMDDAAVAAGSATLALTSTRQLVEDIERATRSSGRALQTVDDVLIEARDEIAGDLATGLDDALATLPGMIDTARVVDRTMRALSLVGVDYDPDVPLDEALTDLQTSLEPLPRGVRAQADLLGEVAGDVTSIAGDAGELSATLLGIRLRLLEAETVADDAVAHIDEAATAFRILSNELGTYRGWAPWVAVVAAIALGSTSTGLLLVGRAMTPAGHPDRINDAT